MGRGLRIGYGAGPTLALGGHDGRWSLEGSGTNPEATAAFTTQASGSSLIVFTAAETATINTPTDNKGNTFTLAEQLDYSPYPGYGNKIYTKAGAAGGSGHVVQFGKAYNNAGEATLIAVEIRGATIIDTSIVYRSPVAAGGDLVTASVTTTGPARLVSFWAGDGNSGTTDQTCNPESGWTTIEALFLAGTAYIQAACAVKDALVSAGTHTMIWRPVVGQGGILTLAAVQA